MDATIVHYPLIVLLSKAKRSASFLKMITTCSMDNNLPGIKANELMIAGTKTRGSILTESGSFRILLPDGCPQISSPQTCETLSNVNARFLAFVLKTCLKLPLSWSLCLAGRRSEATKRKLENLKLTFCDSPTQTCSREKRQRFGLQTKRFVE